MKKLEDLTKRVVKTEKFAFYRLLAVTSKGGTQCDGSMIETLEDLLFKVEDFIKKQDKRDPFINLTIVRVEKEYPV